MFMKKYREQKFDQSIFLFDINTKSLAAPELEQQVPFRKGERSGKSHEWSELFI